MVRLFELVPLFSGNAWIYWSWVAGWSFCIMVTAIYSASVERTANCHLAHLESRGAVRVERNGALHVCGIACKVVGVLLAVASVAWVLLAVASLVDPGMEISQGETVLGIVCLLCGAVWQWGWGSMFCAQAWNEGAAQRILSGAQSEGGRRGLATKKVLSTLDAYRALAIELGADAVGVGALERGDAEVRKLLENKDVSQDAAQRTGREAAASYRKACEKGALAKAASLAEESRRAYGQRQWKEAFLRAEEALYFAPSDPGMVRLRMQTWWKKNRFFVMLAGGLLLVALVVRLVVS